MILLCVYAGMPCCSMELIACVLTEDLCCSFEHQELTWNNSPSRPFGVKESGYSGFVDACVRVPRVLKCSAPSVLRSTRYQVQPWAWCTRGHNPSKFGNERTSLLEVRMKGSKSIKRRYRGNGVGGRRKNGIKLKLQIRAIEARLCD